MLHIRRYEPKDREAVRALHIAAYEHAGVQTIGKSDWDDDLDCIEEVYLAGTGEFLVGALDGKIVTMGALKRLTAEIAEVKRLRTHPEFQRKGFGQEMLFCLEERARELRYLTLQLDVMAMLTVARTWYEKNGYRECKREFLGGHECIFYRKTLTKGE